MSDYQDTYNRAVRPKPTPKPPEKSKPFTPKSTAGAYAMGSPGAPAKPYKKPEPKPEKAKDNKPEKAKDNKPKDTSKAYAMGTSGGSRISTPPKAQESAQRRASSGPRPLYGAEAEWKKKHDFDDATARYKKDKASYDRKAKSGSMQDTVDVENYRKNRIANKEYKGKYYGPDAFKGSMSLLKAWRKAGSPKDVKSFAKSNPNTGR